LTASGTPIAAGILPTDIVLDPSGLFAYVVNENSNDISVYAVDPATGALTAAGNAVGTDNEPRAIAID